MISSRVKIRKADSCHLYYKSLLRVSCLKEGFFLPHIIERFSTLSTAILECDARRRRGWRTASLLLLLLSLSQWHVRCALPLLLLLAVADICCLQSGRLPQILAVGLLSRWEAGAYVLAGQGIPSSGFGIVWWQNRLGQHQVLLFLL